MAKLFLVYQLFFMVGATRPAHFILFSVLLSGEFLLSLRKKTWLKRRLLLTAILLRSLRLALFWTLQIQFFVLDIHVVQSISMQPYLNPGDVVLVDRLTPGLLLPITRFTNHQHIRLLAFRPLQVGDVIAFQYHPLNTIFIKRIQTIQEDKFFVMGDNPTSSLDSRQLGTIPKTAILGRVIFKFSP